MTIRGYQLLALMALGLVAYTHAACDLMIGCDVCVDPEPFCAKCEDGTFPGSDADENKCFECTGNCKTCASATTCKTCEPNYVLKEVDNTLDGTCERCSSGCVTCNYAGAETTCNKCETKKFVQAGKCDNCPNNCDMCSKKETCSKCSANYIKNSNGGAPSGQQCLLCDAASCISCSGEEQADVATCTECKADKYLNNGVCSPCTDTNCVTCKADGQCEIDGCKKGFYKKVDTAQCAACDFECDECDIVQNQPSCIDCKTNFGHKDGKTCDSCDDPKCVTCNSNGACGTCIPGYFAKNTVCTACGANCDECTDQNTCTACFTGYFIDKEIPNVCTLCSDTTGEANGLANCVACADTTALAADADTVCTACATGFYPIEDGSECLACALDNCVACNAVEDECTTCSPGFFLDPSDDTCLAECKATVDKCVVCEDADSCKVCDDGYFKTTGTNCDSCGDNNCMTCTVAATTGKCSDCNPGFALTAAKTCASCPSKCTDSGCSESNTVTGTTVCTDCVSGYVAKDGACVECPANCGTCTPDVSSGDPMCDSNSCNNGYWLNTHKCAGCPANCDDCALEDGVMVCTVCAAEYTKNANDDCKKCPSNCEECSAGTSITCKAGKCKTGYGVSADKTSCEDCAALTRVDNCGTCQDSNSTGFAECTSCADGYFIQDDHMKCLENFEGCADSQDNQVECLKCDTSYNMTEDKKCFIMSYRCASEENPGSAAECNAEGNDYPTEMCLGTAWIYYNKDGTTVTAARGCSTDACTETYKDSEFCVESDQGRLKKCKSCCTKDECNDGILDGNAGLNRNNAGVITTNLWLLLVSVLALLTR